MGGDTLTRQGDLGERGSRMSSKAAMEKTEKKTRKDSTSSEDSLPRSPTRLAPPQTPKSPGRSLTSWKDFDESVELTKLNTNLGQYIELVKQLEAGHQGGLKSSGRTTINVTIDRSQVDIIQEKFTKGLGDLKDKCRKNDEIIAGLRAEIYRLKSEIKQLTKSNSDKESSIGELDLTVGQLKDEVARLEANLSFYKNQKGIFELQVQALQKKITNLNAQLGKVIAELKEKKINNAKLSSDLFRLEKELRFQISVKSRELMAERTKSNIDWEEIKTKKGEKYKIWMEDQLQKLQMTYQQQRGDFEETMKTMYQDKEKTLTASLSKAQNDAAKPNEEANKLKIQLETMKLKFGELEANHNLLTVKKLEISTELENKKNIFLAQMSAKKRELEELEKEYMAIKAKYEEMMKGINAAQVEVYSNTLTPEIRRISGRFGSQQVVSSGKTLNFSRTSSSFSASSASVEVNGVAEIKGIAGIKGLAAEIKK